MMLMEARWGRSREVGCSTTLAETQLPAHCHPIPSGCSFEGVTKHLFSRGVGRISKKWGVMRPQEGRAYLEIQLQLAKLVCDGRSQLRCPAAQPQRRTRQKKPGEKGGTCLMVTAARWAKPAALACSLPEVLSQKAFIRDFPRITPSGGEKEVLMLHNTNA